MKTFRLVLSSLLFVCLASVSLAEPQNIQVAKEHLKQYVNSGQYNTETQKVVDNATHYLAQKITANEKLALPKKLAVVLDIDETALSNYPDMLKSGFGGTLEEIMRQEGQGHDPLIPATLALFNYAKQHGVSVFFVSGRSEWMRQATVKNLKTVGFKDWNGLIMRTEKFQGVPAKEYKTLIRKQLTEKGYVIILNVGDQESDLEGGYSEKNFKLPNPFYYIP
jgi:acid phosphatase